MKIITDDTAIFKKFIFEEIQNPENSDSLH